MCGFVERLAGVEKECGGCDWAGAKGRGCWVGGLLILLFLVRGLFCAGGGGVGVVLRGVCAGCVGSCGVCL